MLLFLREDRGFGWGTLTSRSSSSIWATSPSWFTRWRSSALPAALMESSCSRRQLVQQTKDIIAKHCPQYADAVNVIAGGAERNDTIMNAIRYFEDECQADDASIIVTHDAVRPFVSLRVIEDNIAAALAHGACDTVVPATDTIVESLDGELISSIPNRSVLYQGQTPQSFNMRELRETLESLTPEESAILTDACKAFVLRGKKVALVRGDVSNIKITYPQDMRVAEAMLEA